MNQLRKIIETSCLELGQKLHGKTAIEIAGLIEDYLWKVTIPMVVEYTPSYKFTLEDKPKKH